MGWYVAQNGLGAGGGGGPGSTHPGVPSTVTTPGIHAYDAAIAVVPQAMSFEAGVVNTRSSVRDLTASIVFSVLLTCQP